MTKLTEIVRNKMTLTASSSLQSGTITLEAFTVTKGAGTFLYTGNGTTQDIVTGIPSVDWTVPANGSGFWFDRSTKQVKTDVGGVAPPGECLANISKVHTKGRNANWGNFIFDGLRGVGNWVSTDQTVVEGTATTLLSSFNSDGFTIGSDGNLNNNGDTYLVHQELYTHVKWGTTSSGKLYIEAYNPVTSSSITIYRGDGLNGHNIPSSILPTIDYSEVKCLTQNFEWKARYGYLDEHLILNSTSGAVEDAAVFGNRDITGLELNTNVAVNKFDDSYVAYSKSKSRIWSIIKCAGKSPSDSFIETRDVNGNFREPSRVVLKKTNSTGSWYVFDNKRPLGGVGVALYTLLNSTAAESSSPTISMSFESTGFTLGGTNAETNSDGGEYIALVEFDTNGDGGDSYFDLPTDDTNLNLADAVLTYTDGTEPQGFKVSFASVITESIEFSTAPNGFVYVYRDLLGNYGFDIVEPKFDVTTGYYSGEVAAKSYVAKVMVASGTPQYVDESWVNYKNVTSSLEVQGRLNTKDNVKIVDFGIVFNNRRYVAENPFGNENHRGCIVKAEVYINGIWSETGFIYNAASNVSYGTECTSNYNGLVIQTGISSIASSSNASGGGHDLYANINSAPARVIVAYIGEATDD